MTDDKQTIRHTVRISTDNWHKLIELSAVLSKQAGKRVPMNSIINDAIRAYQLPNDGQRFIE